MKMIWPIAALLCVSCTGKVAPKEEKQVSEPKGVLCFEYEDEVLSDYMNITFRGDSVYGSETGIITDKGQAFHARYESRLKGIRAGDTLHMEIITQAGEEQVNRKDTWLLKDGTLITTDATFKSIDCAKHYVL